MLVHIADARDKRALDRAGIVPWHRRRGAGWGVYAMPVLPNYFISHQWLRELKRRGMRTLVGVYFRLSSREPVVVGHYNGSHAPMTLGSAIRIITDAADARGYELIVPRKVKATEIHSIRPVSQIAGWRYYPGAHGKPVCGCPVCVPLGTMKSRRLRDAFERSMNPEPDEPIAG